MKTRASSECALDGAPGSARAPMTVTKTPFVTEELLWEFLDTSDTGGTLALRWDNVMATVRFAVVTK